MSSQENRSLERPDGPDLSLVVPCYNEEGILGTTVSRLAGAFSEAGHDLELVVVDNGSSDGTWAEIQELSRRLPGIVPHQVAVNQGYGFGVLSGLPRCRGRWVGIIPADGQVDAEDVVRLFEAAKGSGGDVVAKVRRRFRMDGLVRKTVSVAYNLLVRLLWPRLNTLDMNGSPKMIRREHLRAMDLQSPGWFLDPELMIKAHYMGLRILELNVFARMRGRGMSHVRPVTCWEFFRRLLAVRFFGASRAWKRELEPRRRGEPESVLSRPGT